MGDLIWVEQPSGYRFKGCACIRDSWPTITRLAVARGIIRQQIDVTQGSYSTSVDASALTHAGGGVADVRQTMQALDDLLEECGIASYQRDARDGMSPHMHILWIGCPHQHDQAKRQVASWMNKRNGLRSNALDRDQTRPSPIRDWKQGLAWARLQLAQLEDDMPLTQTDATLVARTVITELLSQSLGRSGPTVSVALQDGYWKTVLLERAVGQLVGAAGVDIDETAMAQQVAAIVAPVVRDAVVAAATAGGTPEAVADAVVAKLGAALQD